MGRANRLQSKRSSENFTTKLINKTPSQVQTVISYTLQLRITLWDLLSWKNYAGQLGICLMLCEQEVLDPANPCGWAVGAEELRVTALPQTQTPGAPTQLPLLVLFQ